MPETKANSQNRRRLGTSDLPAIIADEIRGQIVKGKLATGSKLPTEREMSENHGVSRVVVREAIARLRHEGLVTSQQGRGVFVASPEESRFLTIAQSALSRPEDYQRLYDVRKVLESGTAALAALHHDEDDLEELRKHLATMIGPDVNHETYVEADIAFHRAIASASKNPFLVLFISFVDMKLKESISVALKSLNFEETIEVSAEEHDEIFRCLAAHDPEGARQAMQLHLDNSSRRLGL
jgi:DNA-binding FadR family transcriptional regulator